MIKTCALTATTAIIGYVLGRLHPVSPNADDLVPLILFGSLGMTLVLAVATPLVAELRSRPKSNGT